MGADEEDGARAMLRRRVVVVPSVACREYQHRIETMACLISISTIMSFGQHSVLSEALAGHMEVDAPYVSE